ncbi:MAG: hypothetical protein JWQ94_3550 [Tardiphaga sp.]|jgi:hypothetical protein|nr:hypothetical protein [Tardiphaga sp.]
MSIALDSYQVLRAIGKHAELFKPVRAEVDKAARALVLKCLKAKTIDLEALRDIHGALGAESFELLVEGLKDAELKSILTRLDKHDPELKSGSAAWRRQHLLALATGGAPSPPPAKAAKKTTAKKGATGKAGSEPKRLHSETMEIFKHGDKAKK